MFWDNVEIHVTAGKGGNGLISFRTEWGVSKGGPDGGDGGKGGDVVLVADSHRNTLVDYARQKEYKAPAGQPGGKGRKHGKSAEDLLMHVPAGTIVYEGKNVLVDLREHDQRFVVAKGGRGGFGNAHFKSSTRQTPRQAELGEPGQQRDIGMELKLIADVGLVGIPSAGKSTLLAHITDATPKIADYPFTTTVPQLGIASVDERQLVVADIPGLIEGAHQGKGLGDAFLRHIERTKVIIHLLDATANNVAYDYKLIRQELSNFSTKLKDKPEIVVINKIDVLTPEQRDKLRSTLKQELGQEVDEMSAVTGEGVRRVLRQAADIAAAHQEEPLEAEPARILLEDLAPKALSIEKEDGGYRIRGARIEQLATQTDFDNPEAAQRFRDVLTKLGADKRLEKLGAQPGADLRIGDQHVRWQD